MGCRARRAKPKAAAHDRPIPFHLFDEWFAEARASEPNDPEAMALATADADGRPSVRMVLLKGHGPDGFVFYTNRAEREGRDSWPQIPQAALAVPLEVAAPAGAHRRPGRARRRTRGRCLFRQPVARFPARRLGVGPVAAARQPRDLRAAVRGDAGAASTASDVPRPPHWGGYRVRPRADRILDRPRRTGCTSGACSRVDGGGWTEGLLYP